MGLGSEIRDLEKTYYGSQIQGSKGTVSQIRNTAFYLCSAQSRKNGDTW
jgi:predicted ATP-dependent serine protease